MAQLLFVNIVPLLRSNTKSRVTYRGGIHEILELQNRTGFSAGHDHIAWAARSHIRAKAPLRSRLAERFIKEM